MNSGPHMNVGLVGRRRCGCVDVRAPSGRMLELDKGIPREFTVVLVERYCLMLSAQASFRARVRRASTAVHNVSITGTRSPGGMDGAGGSRHLDVLLHACGAGDLDGVGGSFLLVGEIHDQRHRRWGDQGEAVNGSMPQSRSRRQGTRRLRALSPRRRCRPASRPARPERLSSVRGSCYRRRPGWHQRLHALLIDVVLLDREERVVKVPSG